MTISRAGCINHRQVIVFRLLHAAAVLKFGTKDACSGRPRNKIKETAGSRLAGCDTQFCFVQLVPLINAHGFYNKNKSTDHLEKKTLITNFILISSAIWAEHVWIRLVSLMMKIIFTTSEVQITPCEL